MSRAENRAARDRNLAHWKRIVRRQFPCDTVPTKAEQRLARKASAHGKLCSCHMCCNRRSIDGPTIQERRSTSGEE